MLVEIHVLQNHAPSNLNRDDTGSPKDCVFGGVRRARISSQSLKRAIRRSDVFRSELEGVEMAYRTRTLPELVRKQLLERDLSEEMARVGALKASAFGTKDGKDQKETKDQKDVKTAQMMFLTPADIKAVADVMFEAAADVSSPKELEKVSAGELQKRAVLRGWRPLTPDVALFGRMITSDAFRDVDAAVQVAHAISTHKMEHEFDYFTAVDDFLGPEAAEEEQGAGMIGDVEYNSACYYKYFSIDQEGLVRNLAGPEPGERASRADRAAYEQQLDEARKVARQAILAFVKASVFVSPTGKQNTFAAHQLPDAILVEVRDRKIPVSYANAFVMPVTAGRNDLVTESIAAFKRHVQTLTHKFSLPRADSLWFSTQSDSLEGSRYCETIGDLLSALSEAIGGEVSNG